MGKNVGVTEITTGKPIWSLSYRNCVNIGPLGEFAGMLPIKITNVNDLVGRSWTPARPGEIMRPDAAFSRDVSVQISKEAVAVGDLNTRAWLERRDRDQCLRRRYWRCFLGMPALFVALVVFAALIATFDLELNRHVRRILGAAFGVACADVGREPLLPGSSCSVFGVPGAVNGLPCHGG